VIRAALAALAAVLVLASCTTVQTLPPTHGAATAPPPSPPPPIKVVSRNAATLGIARGPEVATLVTTKARAGNALAAFRASCRSLLKRVDASGLTQPEDWQPACDAAATAKWLDATGFFQQWFEAAVIGDGKSLATGYFEPEIAASLLRAPGFATPIYRRPADLVGVDLGQFSPDLQGKRVRGRVSGPALVPYYERGQIVDGALSGQNLEIAWAADPIEFFFLQIQGSGRLRLPDGSIMRIGYDDQNGRDYVGIGKLLLDRGLLQPGQATMQGIIAWLRANPDQADAIMRQNKSFVFFKVNAGAGPLGAMGVTLTPEGSVAADPAFVPLGAPVWLTMDNPAADGVWVAQDTGGAIKGPNRVDTFWGAGDKARATAGGMSVRGTAVVLLPRGVLARLGR
jgi:membrane-bound lytic murein transglycosylase A